MMRVSYKTNFDYISVKFAQFLCLYSTFSAQDLAYNSGQNMDVVTLCLMRLKSKKILIEKKANRNKIMPDQFELLISPYIQEEMPKWVKDYAGMSFSNVRHS